MDHVPTYLRPDAERIAEQKGYSIEQRDLLRRFASQGYVIVDVEEPDFEQLANEIIDELDVGDKRYVRVQDAWQNVSAVKRLACNEKLLSALEVLYGRKPFPFQTLNFDEGTEQATRCDSVHFDSFPHGFMAGVWIALENIDANNGPLHYFPKSHLLPHVSLAEAGVRSDNGYVDYDAFYLPLLKSIIEAHGFTKEEGYIRKGQAVIWAANLAHGGSPIREKGRSRHSQVTHYYFDNCAYYTPMLSDPLLGKVELRAPLDVRTGKPRLSEYAGQQIPLDVPIPMSSARRAALKLLDKLGL
jgi:hypothetical protein